jgi:hypothetical protein
MVVEEEEALVRLAQMGHIQHLGQVVMVLIITIVLVQMKLEAVVAVRQGLLGITEVQGVVVAVE